MAERTFAGKNQRSEFDQKIIDIRRVARVVAGGRRFNFRVSIIAGNRKGQVGFGMGKSGDTAAAIEKAFRNAKKNMISIPLTADFSIPHETEAKYSTSRVLLKPAPRGKRLVAGSSVRTVLDLAGVRNSVTKIFSRSKNQINNAKAALAALKKLKTLK